MPGLTDDIEALTPGDLDGQGGWSADSQYWDVIDTPAYGIYAGSRSIRFGGTSGARARRTFNGSGEYYGRQRVYFRPALIGVSITALGIMAYNDSNRLATIETQDPYSGDYFCFYYNSGFDVLGSLTYDTWYKLEIEWRFESPNIKYRARLDDGTWTAWRNSIQGGVPGKVYMGDTNNYTCNYYWDEFFGTESGSLLRLDQSYALVAPTLTQSELDQAYILLAPSLNLSLLNQAYVLLAPALNQAVLDELWTITGYAVHTQQLDENWSILIAYMQEQKLNQLYQILADPMVSPVLKQVRFICKLVN